MSAFAVAVVGTGPPRESRDEDTAGMGMGHYHGDAYLEIEECELVACADLVGEHAAAYAREYDIDADSAFTDHEEMLATVEPDVVSVATPPAAHAEIVVDCARAGVEAIHCEKPMALTWEGCRRMVEECEGQGVQLTINHQRRFNPRWRTAGKRIAVGDVGTVRRVELGAPDLLDWGTHCFDLAGWYAGEPAADWVIGQVDAVVDDFYGGAHGHHTETGAVGLWAYENGVHGLAATGENADAVGGRVFHRVLGTAGTIEVGSDMDPRLRPNGGSEWVDLLAEHGPDAETGVVPDVRRGIEDALDALGTGRTPELAGERALNATELIFGIYESARRRGRVDCPLSIEDNPLEAMVEAGDLPVREG